MKETVTLEFFYFIEKTKNYWNQFITRIQNVHKIICKGSSYRRIKYYYKSISNQIAVANLFQAIVNMIKFSYNSLIVNTMKLKYNSVLPEI